MGFYANRVLPKIVDYACGLEPARRQRDKIVPLASGRVLDVGVGSGRNLPHYDAARVTRLWGLDPSPAMTRLAAKRARDAGLDLELLDQPVEEMPLDDGSVDTVVLTYTLCSVGDPAAALAQMRRVLAPGGRLLFCEHGAAPDPSVRRWQDRVTPVWKRFGGGCHLNRAIPALIERGGFRIEKLETMYLPGWRPASFNYWGSALPA